MLLGTIPKTIWAVVDVRVAECTFHPKVKKKKKKKKKEKKNALKKFLIFF